MNAVAIAPHRLTIRPRIPIIAAAPSSSPGMLLSEYNLMTPIIVPTSAIIKQRKTSPFIAMSDTPVTLSLMTIQSMRDMIEKPEKIQARVTKALAI